MKLNQDQLVVLARCLNYGENAISQEENQNGIGDKIRLEIMEIRRQLLMEMQILVEPSFKTS